MLRHLATFLRTCGPYGLPHAAPARPAPPRAGRTSRTPRGHRTPVTTGLTAGTGDVAPLVRLVLPATIVPTLGCDAVGVPARHGFRLLARLPRNGCVFADADWWWWIVPAGSDQELTWPLPAHYAEGAHVPADRPRLVHWPDDDSPYTPPIPLYLMACQLTGTAPLWRVGVGGRA